MGCGLQISKNQYANHFVQITPDDQIWAKINFGESCENQMFQCIKCDTEVKAKEVKHHHCFAYRIIHELNKTIDDYRNKNKELVNDIKLLIDSGNVWTTRKEWDSWKQSKRQKTEHKQEVAENDDKLTSEPTQG